MSRCDAPRRAHAHPVHARGTGRRRLRAVRAALAGVVLAAGMLVAVPGGAAAVPVEGYAPYQPQENCNPDPKPGTVALARWLQRRYPGTGLLGISRTCRAAGVSEHKEGRALDWGVKQSSARDRGYVRDLLDRLWAADRDGNEDALARRMGIMYLIWNDHIWSAGNGFEKRDYLNSSCRKVSRCPTTLRHRDHVHISLSRAGARGDTSWYRRNDPPAPEPAPEPTPEPEPIPEPEPVPVPQRTLDLERRPYARLAVPGTGDPVVAGFALEAGRTYKLTASGLVTYGRPDQVADASCVWAGGWQPVPGAATRRARGSLNLTVNGRAVFGSECHPRGHTYVARLTPHRRTALRLQLANGGPAPLAPAGRIVVTVSRARTDVSRALPDLPALRPAPTGREALRGYGLLAETVAVPAAAGGVTTVQELQRGARYRVTVSGVVRLGDGVRSDGRCVRLGGSWYGAASLDRRVPDQDHGNLYLDGVPFAGRSTGDGCSAHEYVIEHTALRTGRLRLALWDPLTRADNRGSLTVRVQRLSAIASPPAARRDRPGRGDAWTRGRDWLEVPADRARGVLTGLKLRAGEEVQLVVRGTVRSHGLAADASCVRVGGTWTGRDPALALPQDPLELWVDGQRVRWRALGATAGCSEERGYTVRYTAPKPGRLRLAVLDLDHRDNEGSLEVTVLRQR